MTLFLLLVCSRPHTYIPWQCEPGHFCVQGIRFPCPGGRFGASARETRSECQGECSAGWYCPEGSVSSNQVCEKHSEQVTTAVFFDEVIHGRSARLLLLPRRRSRLGIAGQPKRKAFNIPCRLHNRGAVEAKTSPRKHFIRFHSKPDMFGKRWFLVDKTWVHR